jgi:hypothetical protein
VADKKDTELERRVAIDAIANAVGLEIADPYGDGVAANFTRIESLASLVMAFPLPEDVEIGAVFSP